ncbi:hypothetical protein ACFVRU_55305 [Streptomyces sp. NPDC057927]
MGEKNYNRPQILELDDNAIMEGFKTLEDEQYKVKISFNGSDKMMDEVEEFKFLKRPSFLDIKNVHTVELAEGQLLNIVQLIDNTWVVGEDWFRMCVWHNEYEMISFNDKKKLLEYVKEKYGRKIFKEINLD